jgi:hypothetical protein
LSTALSLQRTQNLSYALQGLRSNFVLSAFAITSRRLDTLSTGVDDLSQVDVLRQHGYSLTWSYRLTPTSSLVVSAAEQRTPGRGVVAGNGLKSLNVVWGEQISGQLRVGPSRPGRRLQPLHRVSRHGQARYQLLTPCTRPFMA